MIEWTEICLAATSAALLAGAFVPRLRAYRSLLLGGGVLLLITALFPRHGNLLGRFLLMGPSGAPRLPLELFGVAWWLLGAWLLKGVIDLILHRTLFPQDNQPHARRLFADLVSVLVYVLALVGIMDTVFKMQISAVLATSGVLAIILGLALQNTLADVFAGLAINIERPFTAGDWITVTEHMEGQVIEINWRATRIKTAGNDMIVIPNSVIAKAAVVNHRRLDQPHLFSIRLKVDHSISAAVVIDTLQTAASASPGIAPGTHPTAYASDFADSLVAYELYASIDDFTHKEIVQSDIIRRVIDALHSARIPIGTLALDVRVTQGMPGSGA